MKYLQISGIDNINELADVAMLATLDALIASNKISYEDALDFKENHVAQYVSKEMPIWQRILSRLNSNRTVVVTKIVAISDS